MCLYLANWLMWGALSSHIQARARLSNERALDRALVRLQAGVRSRIMVYSQRYLGLRTARDVQGLLVPQALFCSADARAPAAGFFLREDHRRTGPGGTEPAAR